MASVSIRSFVWCHRHRHYHRQCHRLISINGPTLAYSPTLNHVPCTFDWLVAQANKPERLYKISVYGCKSVRECVASNIFFALILLPFASLAGFVCLSQSPILLSIGFPFSFSFSSSFVHSHCYILWRWSNGKFIWHIKAVQRRVQRVFVKLWLRYSGTANTSRYSSSVNMNGRLAMFWWWAQSKMWTYTLVNSLCGNFQRDENYD